MSLKKQEKKTHTGVRLSQGEYAVRLRVTKPVSCQECHKQLTRGQLFWLDYIPLRHPTGKRTHYKKVICEACWRGPRNVWSER